MLPYMWYSYFWGTLLSYGQPRAGISRLWQVSQFHHVSPEFACFTCEVFGGGFNWGHLWGRSCLCGIGSHDWEVGIAGLTDRNHLPEIWCISLRVKIHHRMQLHPLWVDGLLFFEGLPEQKLPQGLGVATPWASWILHERFVLQCGNMWQFTKLQVARAEEKLQSAKDARDEDSTENIQKMGPQGFEWFWSVKIHHVLPLKPARARTTRPSKQQKFHWLIPSAP